MSSIIPFTKENENILPDDFANQDFSTIGFLEAGKVGGSPAAFNISLDRFYARLLLSKDQKQHDVERRKEEIEIHTNSFIEKIEVHQKEIERIKENDLPEAENKVKEANNKLNEFRANPSKFIKEEKDNFYLMFYGILSITVAVFLYFFYSSVVYSAIFRDISISKFTIFNSIFYPKAIEESFAKGIAPFMVIIFAPFIFLALGILIEYFKNKPNPKFKYTWLIIAIGTFIMDSILAYHIADRIYYSKAINTFENVKPFTFLDAVMDLNFWIVIALGYCVYLVFGKVFSLYNEQRLNKNKFEQMENLLNRNLQSAIENVEKLKTKIKELDTEIYSLEVQKAEIVKTSEKIFYSPHELRKILSDYALGWINFLHNGKYSESDIKSIETTLNIFYQQKGINTNEC
ncbi:MAG: hypothetical protein QHH13_04205 [Melioribacter sp.]|uniref:hypothetical protein n=1 Tax=Rosettibacter primus TaxID=3111523 RepID=UPI00247E517B|nr:hypothetical protein [Melioribacter sp.]